LEGLVFQISYDTLRLAARGLIFKLKEVGNIKVIGDQRPGIAAGSSLLQNRFQAFNEIVTILVAIEDFTATDSASNDMVQGTRSINSGLAWQE
jgi:hypothetical protein